MQHMERALALARLALGNTSPNPAVGALIVKDGKPVAEGRTQPRGSWHAEIVALRSAGEAARGADLYVTLEPCCHYGHTPPCTRAIIEAGIANVHIATLDRNPLVGGRGAAELRAAGIGVYLGEGEPEALDLYRPFFHYVTKGIPFVTAKYAMSLDGKIATYSGSSRWITGEPARQRVHLLRRCSDAILAGVGTVIADDPQLTARCDHGDAAVAGRQPVRVIVDSHCRMPTEARLLSEPGQVLVATTRYACQDKRQTLQSLGAEVVTLPPLEGGIDLSSLLQLLGRREITSVFVEGGGTLLGSLFDAGLVDKVVAFVAPIVVGGSKAPSPIEGKGVDPISNALRLRESRIEKLGDDFLIVGYVEK